MKVTDYIIDFLIEKGVTDIFGYPGGVICHLMDSVLKRSNEIRNHGTYHEQGAAFAACGYAQSTGKVGVAYATSGPGATNLVTGVANAYFDSIPTIFITGQVDTYANKGKLPIRQRGFQETDVVAIMSGISKCCINVDSPDKIRYCLEKAYWGATEGNPGPVVLDIPADVQRADVDVNSLESFCTEEIAEEDVFSKIAIIKGALQGAKRPCLLIGNGVKQSGQKENTRSLIERLKIPTVFSMPAFDVLPYQHELNYGFIGANGHRYANFVLSKSDLIISIGSRLDLKQVGNNREQFCPDAKIVRIDIDGGNFVYKVHNDEIDIVVDIKRFLPVLLGHADEFDMCNVKWRKTCTKIKVKLQEMDRDIYHQIISVLSQKIPENSVMTVDVGQSQVWAAQALKIKNNQNVYMSAGHGAMGYSLPAAIGAYYANKCNIISFNGDGGIQMNIQELQMIKRDRIPMKIIILNNYSLGMIRGFQENNFESNYIYTTEESGYLPPDFERIAGAYDLQYTKIKNVEEAIQFEFKKGVAELIEITLPRESILVPNFGQRGKIQDQRPYLERQLYDELMGL